MTRLVSKWSAGAVLAGVVVAAICGGAWAQDPFDPLSLWERAALYRDEWGTPHVYADDYLALAFAFGYAQAEDHLEPMLLAYRIANGRAAEVLGEDLVPSDEFSLKIGHAMLAKSALPRLDPLSRDLCEGFAAGVNAWLVDHPDRVPPWADGAKPEDILALLHCYLMSMAPFDLPNTYRRSPPSLSGNAWAVAPSHSQTGETLLVLNPHAFYDGPFQWYEAHLVCGDLNVAGATLFGLPVILQGHNEVLGWALTPNQPDFADVFIEPPFESSTNPKAVGKPALPSEQQLLQAFLLANTKLYYVDTPQGMVQRGVACVDTVRGPVMGVQGGRMCSYQVGGYRDFGALRQFVEMGRARELGGFQAALGMQQVPCFHILYADQAGNIFYVYNAKMGDKPVFEPPRRRGEQEAAGENAPAPKPVDWTAPVPVERYGWGPLISPEALPSVMNPESGYLQTCGTPPWGVTDNSGLRPDAYPPWFAQDRDTFRARRVRQLLGMGKRSFEDCQSMLYDIVVPLAAEVIPRLLETADQRRTLAADAHPDVAIGLQVLREWNGLAEPRSTGMTFFHAWWTALHAQDLRALFPDRDIYSVIQEYPPAFQDAALNAAAEAARLMRNEFNSLTVPWGDVHTVQRGPREVALPGATTGEPLFATGDFLYAGRKWRVNHGYGYAMAVSFGASPSAVSVAPFGASENPGSPHYDDQLDLLADRRFKVTRFRAEDVQQHASLAQGRVLYLRPVGMEALFVVRAAIPVEMRLDASVEAPAPLPPDTAPYTLFVRLDRAPLDAPLRVEMQVRVPPGLCAPENLPQLAVYACDATQTWTRLPDQRLEPDTATFAASDELASRTYAVLGPVLKRPAAPVVPGRTETEADTASAPPGPETAASDAAARAPESAPLPNTVTAPAPEVSEPARNAVLVPQDTPAVPRPNHSVWSRPARPESKPFQMPNPDELKGPELPRIDFELPEKGQDPKQAARGEKASKDKQHVRRNFNVNLPGFAEEPKPAHPKKGLFKGLFKKSAPEQAPTEDRPQPGG